MSDPTSDGQALIRRFLAAQERLTDAQREVNSSECELRNAEASLAKWLMPADMKVGEKIAVWFGDSLFQVELVPMTGYSAKDGVEAVVSQEPKVTVRMRGKEFGRLRIAQ